MRESPVTSSGTRRRRGTCTGGSCTARPAPRAPRGRRRPALPAAGRVPRPARGRSVRPAGAGRSVTESVAEPGAAQPGLEESPYVGLVPYTEGDAPFFFGREREQRIV